MPSRDASPSALERIRRALEHHHVTDEVLWKRPAREFLDRHADVLGCDMATVNRLLHDHVAAGGHVREQDSPPGEFEERLCFSVILEINDADYFLEFVLFRDDEIDPRIRIVSFHEQRP